MTSPPSCRRIIGIMLLHMIPGVTSFLSLKVPLQENRRSIRFQQQKQQKQQVRGEKLRLFQESISSSSSSSSSSFSSLLGIHLVDGMECREVTIDIQRVGQVTILEATAQAQEELVDMALALDDDQVPFAHDDNDTNHKKENNGGDDATTTIKKQQKQRLQAGDPYGAVLWPAASAIANHLLLLTPCDDGGGDGDGDGGSRVISNTTILELGTGTGLVSLAASLGGYLHIHATDYEPVPLKLLDYAQTNLNKGLTTIETYVCDMTIPLPPADIVVAADIMYEPKTGIAMAHRTVEALRRGSRVLVGDSPGRPGRPAFLQELQRLGIIDAVFVDTVGQTCSGPRHDLICGKGSTSISDEPQDLAVAVMDLNPNDYTHLLL